MAKHTNTIDEACNNLWQLLSKLNKEYKGDAKDAEQYHDIVASLYKLKGLEMASQYEDEQGGASQRGGGSYRGNSYDNGGGNGHSGLYWEPWMGNSYGNGNSYAQGGSYNQGGGSYNGGYSQGGSYNGNSYGGGSYGGSYEGNGYSGRNQPRNAQGQFKEDGYSNRGGSYGASYHSQQDLIQDLRECMQDADPETQRAYRKVIRDMQM